MIPRIVTTAGPLWESELVERARMTGTLRITERAFHPTQVHRALEEQRARAVLVGAEIPWLSPGLVGAWRKMGAAVIGVNDPHHPPSSRLLEDWGCHFVLEEPDPEWAVAALRVASPAPDAAPVGRAGPKVVAVGGPRGAPGRTEVALGLAWLAARNGPCLLVEADTSPALGLRLGLSPPTRLHEPVTVDGIDLLLWDPRGSSGGVLHSGWSRLWDYRTVVVDLGPGHRAFEKWPGERVLVCRASPSGIVRAASLLATLGKGRYSWMVINRLAANEHLRREVPSHLSTWTGRQPDALIGELDDLQWGMPPPASIQAALEPLAARFSQTGKESLGGWVASQPAQVTHGNQVRLEHRVHPLGSGRVDQVDKEAVTPCFGGGTGLDPGQVGPPGG